MQGRVHPRLFSHISQALHKQSRAMLPGADTSFAHLFTSSLARRLPHVTRTSLYQARIRPLLISSPPLFFLRLMLLDSAGEREKTTENAPTRSRCLEGSDA